MTALLTLFLSHYLPSLLHILVVVPSPSLPHIGVDGVEMSSLLQYFLPVHGSFGWLILIYLDFSLWNWSQTPHPLFIDLVPVTLNLLF